MLAFYRAHTNPGVIVPQAVAQIGAGSKVPKPVTRTASHNDSILWSIPWGHHAFLMDRVDDPAVRVWYMAETLSNGWSRNVLLAMIQSAAHRRKGKSITNFDRLLPAPQSDLVRQALKDPYVFDFLTLEEPFHERELETNLLHQLERFLLELGRGFAFVGRQVHMEVGNRDFFIDLLIEGRHQLTVTRPNPSRGNQNRLRRRRPSRRLRPATIASPDRAANRPTMRSKPCRPSRR